MSKKYLLLTLLSYLICQVTFAQQVTYQISYNVGTFDLFGNVKQTSDNGYIIGGTDLDIFGPEAALVKTDTAGTVVWSKTYGGGFFESWTANDVIQTADGGYILTGAHDGDVLLIKTNALGVEQWSMEYGGSDSDWGNMVKQTSDGGYIVAGGSYSFSSKDSSSFYLLKVTSLGALVWDKVYEISTIDDEPAMAVEELVDGYVIVGSTPQVFGSDTTRDGVIIRTNLTGDLRWAKTYGPDSYSEEFYDVKQISTGKLLITGYTTAPSSGSVSDIMMMQVDTAAGAINFSSSYDVGFQDQPYSVQQTSDGGMAAFGFTITNLFPLTIKSFLLKTNSTGTVQISRQFGAGIGSIFGKGEETNDGGFVLGSMQGNATWDFHIYKTDALGSTVCNDTNISAGQNAYVPAITTPSVTLFTGGSGSSLSPSESNNTPVVNVLCIAAPCSPPPTPTLSATETNVCESETGVVYTSQSGLDSYTWTVTGGTITSGQGTNNIIVDWGTGPTGTVDLLIDSAGCAGNLSTENVSIADPAPTLSTTSTSVCDGQTSVTYSTQAGFSTYTWTASGGSIVSGAGTNSITIDWGSPGAGTVDLTVVDAFGCTGALSATENVTINPNPIPTLSVSDTIVCDGQTGVTYATQSGFSTYTWTIGGGSVASGAGANSITVDWGSSGGGTVDVTVVDGNGCTGSLSSTQTITINPNPVPTLSTTSTSVCDGQVGVVFTTESFYSTYSWTITGGSIASGAGTDSINVDWGGPGGGTVDLTVIDTNGCSGSLASTETVTINTSPSPTLTVTDTIVCENEAGLTYTTQSGYTNYIWTVVGGTITSGQGMNSINVDWGSSGGGTVDLTVDSNGCSGSLSSIETVTILVGPTANLTPSGTTSFCTGDSVQLMSDTATTYLWLLNTSSTGLASQGIYVTTPGIYQVVVTNAAGCPDTSSISVILENPSPAATITASGPIAFCGGDSVTLTADTATTYLWFLDGVSTGQTSQSITVTTNGDYQVATTNAFCQDTSAIVTVAVNFNTDLTTTSTVVDSSTCGNSDGSITGTVAGGTAPFTFEWTNSTGTVVGGDSTDLVNVPADSYTLTVTDSTGCTATAGFIIFDIGAPPTPTAGPDAMYCQGDVIADLTATGTGGILIWYSDAILTDSVGTGSPFTSGATTSSVFYVTETIAGCQSAADFVTIIINSTPASPVAGTDSTYCSGNSIADLTVSGGGGTFTWYSDALLTDSIGTGSPFVSGATATDTFYVTETSGGCESSADAVFITIITTPVGLVTSGNAFYCVGDIAADLTATGAGGVITWYSNSGLTDTVFTGSPFSSGAATDTTFYVTETSNACASAKDSIVITFGVPPEITIDAGANASICQGSSITLTASGGTSYLWSNGAITASITVNPTVNTVYSVIGSTAGCADTAATTSVSISSGGIIAGFSAAPITGNIPLNVVFTDTSVGAVSWQWDFSYDSLIFNDESSLENPDFDFTNGGIYQIVLVAADLTGCTDTASMTLTLDVTEEVFIPNLFTPNGDGNNDILYVRGNGIDNLYLVIYDRWGEKIYEGDYSQTWALEDTYPSDIGWDGTFNDQPLNTAVFVYVLTGSFISGKEIEEQGNITLVK